MTPDLERLRKSKRKLAWLFDEIELTLVDDPLWPEPSDHSYLSAAQRRNPDIAANVEAMDATNKLIAWFGRDMRGYVGLWRGPADHALAATPIVRLDSEGQYAIAAFTIGDWIARTVREDYFADARRALIAAGFKVRKTIDDIYETIDQRDRKNDDPNEYRNQLYYAAKKRASAKGTKSKAKAKPRSKPKAKSR